MKKGGAVPVEGGRWSVRRHGPPGAGLHEEGEPRFVRTGDGVHEAPGAVEDRPGDGRADLASRAFPWYDQESFVAEAAKAYLEQRREEVRQGMIESMKVLDGSLTSGVAALTGLSPERIEQLGGVGEWED